MKVSIRSEINNQNNLLKWDKFFSLLQYTKKSHLFSKPIYILSFKFCMNYMLPFKTLPEIYANP